MFLFLVNAFVKFMFFYATIYFWWWLYVTKKLKVQIFNKKLKVEII